jgi:DinB superfamily
MLAPSRAQTLATLEAGQEELDALFGQLTDAELGQPATIGPGEWAAKDLMGHIAFWEELALETIDAWRAGRRPRVEDISGPAGTDRANADNQAQTAPRSPAEIRSRAASVHQALLAVIHSLSEDEWNAPAPYDSPTRPSLSELLGGVLGAPNSPFGHAYAHLDDLRTYVRSRGEAAG